MSTKKAHRARPLLAVALFITMLVAGTPAAAQAAQPAQVSVVSVGTAAKKSTTYKVSANLHLRQKATKASKSLAVMSKGSAVVATGATSGKWIKVTHKGKTGWASSSYMKKSGAVSTTAKKPAAKKTVAKKTAKPSYSHLSAKQRSNLTYANQLSKKHGFSIVQSNSRCKQARGILLGCYTPGKADPIVITSHGLNQSKAKIKHIALHEVSHGVILKKCGTTMPRIAGSRIEAVTNAYSVLLGATNVWGLNYSQSDMAKAKKIRNKVCG